MEKDKLLLKILIEGAEIWNQLRSENPQLFIDFNDADLSGANLNRVDLSGANLRKANLGKAYLNKANLSEANLNGARLWKADLIGANLNEANLKKADLSEADLDGASLSGADLSEANLRKANLNGANFHGANLSGANLWKANLIKADLSGANLSDAYLSGADLRAANLFNANLGYADISLANLSGANLSEANLRNVDLHGADLSEANLSHAALVQSNLKNAKLTNCRIDGISAWDIEFSDNAEQRDLIITPHDQLTITVDNLEVAQFIYLLLKNEKIHYIIDAMTSKVVLILGRFTEERKVILDALREELRRRNLTPISFEFKRPASKDVTGTVETIARMARFVVADLTDPNSIPHELATIVPLLRTTPVLPLRLTGSGGYSMFDDFKSYPWVLGISEYLDADSLLSKLSQVIAPANEMAERLRKMT